MLSLKAHSDCAPYGAVNAEPRGAAPYGRTARLGAVRRRGQTAQTPGQLIALIAMLSKTVVREGCIVYTPAPGQVTDIQTPARGPGAAV